jgi:hypothetical protein
VLRCVQPRLAQRRVEERRRMPREQHSDLHQARPRGAGQRAPRHAPRPRPKRRGGTRTPCARQRPGPRRERMAGDQQRRDDEHQDFVLDHVRGK